MCRSHTWWTVVSDGNICVPCQSFLCRTLSLRHVYVTQGAVYWGIPMRMFSEAEITQVFLRSA